MHMSIKFLQTSNEGDLHIIGVTRAIQNRTGYIASATFLSGYASPIRKPRGEDIMAACGQLKSATERARKSKAQIEAETRSA